MPVYAIAAAAGCVHALPLLPTRMPACHAQMFASPSACTIAAASAAAGLKDAEECIRLAPEFAKGYSRKGHLQFFTKVGGMGGWVGG